MTTKEKIIESIDRIPEEKLGELLAVVEGFRDKSAVAPVGKSKWSEFAGIFTDEEAAAMKEAIDRECEVEGE